MAAAGDWCHFSQRVERSSGHRHLKGGVLGYEDEKFSYVVLTRAPVVRRAARVLAQPEVSKIAVTAKLCAPDGVAISKIPRRVKMDYARARRWRWGDTVT